MNSTRPPVCLLMGRGKTPELLQGGGVGKKPFLLLRRQGSKEGVGDTPSDFRSISSKRRKRLGFWGRGGDKKT